jgi:hypothetical protein
MPKPSRAAKQGCLRPHLASVVYNGFLLLVLIAVFKLPLFRDPMNGGRMAL